MIPAVDNIPQPPKEQEKQEEKIVQPALVENQQIPQETAKEEKSEDPNWRAFREARKKDRAEKEAAEKRAAEKEAEAAALRAAMEAAFTKEQTAYRQPAQNSHEYLPEESEDQRIERKVQQAIALKEEQYRRDNEEREKREAPQKLMRALPDFQQVVTQDNCDYIDYHYPELTAPFKHMPEGYDKWVAMYNVIKKFVPNHANAQREASRADTNFSKPKSMSAPGMTQMPENLSVRLSEDRKAANWERMQRTLKGITS